MENERDPNLTAYRLPGEPGPGDPLPRELDTAARWERRARLVRPDAEPAGQLAMDGGWVPVFGVRATVPIESDADLDATSAYPRASRVPGVYDYWLPSDNPEDGDG
ncbi:hypothetical protein [Thiohalorhabdus methylotrophus]|uniref:Uncharacterized protein n=1 Tax=Thiohalorhabdus methylotrophus TaxID=3242694 RepID=A0ABV4U119_9GAMM